MEDSKLIGYYNIATPFVLRYYRFYLMSFDFNTFIAAASGAGVFTFLFKIGEKFVDEHFLDRRSSKISKSKLTDEIIKICSEGRNSLFKSSPRNLEHIEFIIHKVNLYNEKIGKQLDELVTTWVLIGKLSKGSKIQGIDDDAYEAIVEKLQEDQRLLSNRLLKQIKKW